MKDLKTILSDRRTFNRAMSSAQSEIQRKSETAATGTLFYSVRAELNQYYLQRDMPEILAFVIYEDIDKHILDPSFVATVTTV